MNGNGTAGHIHDYNRTPLYLQVRDSLMARIQSGEWPAGRTIPNELTLGQEYGVSSGTMRKALDMLEHQLVLTRRQGRGTFIREMLAFDELPESAKSFLSFGDASVQGASVRDRSGVLHDASALRRLAEGALEVSGWLERQALQKKSVKSNQQRSA